MVSWANPIVLRAKKSQKIQKFFIIKNQNCKDNKKKGENQVNMKNRRFLRVRAQAKYPAS